MNVTTQVLNVTEYEARHYLPATLVPRSGSDLWLVRDEPPGASKTGVPWSYACEGKQVRIPLLSYLSKNLDPAFAVGMAFQVGCTILAEAAPIIDGREVQRLHIIVGHPLIDLSPNGGSQSFKMWLGVGILLGDKRAQ